jgi:hypothetical protein
MTIESWRRFDRILGNRADPAVRRRVMGRLYDKTVCFVHGRHIVQPHIKGTRTQVTIQRRVRGWIVRYKQQGKPGITINSYTQLYSIMYFHGELHSD